MPSTVLVEQAPLAAHSHCQAAGGWTSAALQDWAGILPLSLGAQCYASCSAQRSMLLLPFVPAAAAACLCLPVLL